MKKPCCESRNQLRCHARRSGTHARSDRFVVRLNSAPDYQSARASVGNRSIGERPSIVAVLSVNLRRNSAARETLSYDLTAGPAKTEYPFRCRSRRHGIYAHGVTHPQDHGFDRERSIVCGF
jgi:hypothetical protein